MVPLVSADVDVARAVHAMRDPLAVVARGSVVVANPAFRRLEARAGDVLGALAPLLTAPAAGEVVVDEDGRAVAFLATVDRLDDDAVVVVLHERPVSSAAAEPAADRDPLTGLLNRAGLAPRIERELATARRHARPLSVAIIDLDHFKRINDTFGHPVGDQVLREAATRLRAVVRPQDTLARIGGEEFAWLLPDAPGSAAAAAADRARAALSGAAFEHGMPVTASVGIYELGEGDDLDLLYRRADQALYWAKQHGRNMTLIWTPEAAAHLRQGAAGGRPSWEELLDVATMVDGLVDHSGRHGARVADLAMALAVQLDWTPERVGRLHRAARIHDVGKVAAPRELVSRPGPLTAAEMSQLRQHAAIGAAMADRTLDHEQLGWIRHHHERWDGGGYPDGLAGESIPTGAHLLGLADAFDAMTSERPYAHAMTVDEALREIDRGAGRAYAPDARPRLEAALAWLDRAHG